VSVVLPILGEQNGENSSHLDDRSADYLLDRNTLERRPLREYRGPVIDGSIVDSISRQQHAGGADIGKSRG
jgi:hypothetical protein